MARLGSTASIVAAVIAFGATARAQPVMLGMQDADPPTEDAPVQPLLPAPKLLPPPASALPPCCCGYMPLPYDPMEPELTTAIVVGATVASFGYLLALLLAADEPRGLSTIDAVPVVGAIYAAQRGGIDDQRGPVYLFAAGVQAIGALVIGVAATELAQRRRLLLDISAAPSGAGAALTWRF
jgi:hypothetical protein